MKRKGRILSSVILAVVVIGLASYIYRESSKESLQAEIHRSGSRAPASIQKVFDYSSLQGPALVSASKQRLLSSMNISHESGTAVIEMGNFVLSTDGSSKDFACGFYDQVVFEFDADGVAVDGEKPHITVQSGCEVGDNINSWAPIRVPFAKLKVNPPAESAYTFYDDHKPMRIQISNPPADWPGQWVLTDVKLTNSQEPSRILHIESGDIQASTGKIKMNW